MGDELLMADQVQHLPVAGRGARRHLNLPPFDRDGLGPDRRERTSLFAPGSPVVVTARALLAAHSGTRADGTCARCDLPSPCPTLQNATEVCQAAGEPVSGRTADPYRLSGLRQRAA